MRCTLREHHRQQQQQQICSPNIDLSIIRCELCPTDCCVALAFFFFGKYFAHAAYTWHFFGVSCALSFHTAAAADWSSTNEKKKKKNTMRILCAIFNFELSGTRAIRQSFPTYRSSHWKYRREQQKKNCLYMWFSLFIFFSLVIPLLLHETKNCFSHICGCGEQAGKRRRNKKNNSVRRFVSRSRMVGIYHRCTVPLK